MESLKTWQKTNIVLPRWSTAWLKVLLSNCAAAKAISLLAILLAALPARALIFYGSADPEYNTTAPTGDVANSGWDVEGNWGTSIGTPIGPRHFITANHVGGAVGDYLYFRGVFYKTVSTAVDSISDLRIWEIAGTFPAWAELYDGPTETGADLVVFGRGSIRGDEVRVNGALRGWQWGAYDTRMRWGRNRVSSITTTPNYPASDVLMVAFESSGTADEAHLAYGDSSGGVFIKQGATWRLAGINFVVDGPYNTAPAGAGFTAAIFDEGGLYKRSAANWILVPDLPTSQAGNFYATRIKSRLTWIQSVLAAPPTQWATLVQADSANGTFTSAGNVTWDANAKTFTLPAPVGPTFFQIEGTVTVRIIGSRLENGTLVLSYE